MKRFLHLVSVKNITFKFSYNWFWCPLSTSLPFCTTQLTACFPKKCLQPPHLPLQLVDLGVKEPLVAGGVLVPPAVTFFTVLRHWTNAAEQVGDKLASPLFVIIIPSIISLWLPSLNQFCHDGRPQFLQYRCNSQ